MSKLKCEKDRKFIQHINNECREYSRPSYIGPYPRQHADIAPYIAGFTVLLDILYYWALRTGRMSLESVTITFIVGGLMFMTAYSAGFLGVWYSEKQKQAEADKE